MNKVALVGRLTKDVEMRNSGENALAKFSVAINRPFKDKNGEYTADFINCTAFGKTAEFVSNYFGKGDPIGVTGRIQTGKYTNKEGATVYTTDVVAESVEFVCGKKENGGDNSGNPKNNKAHSKPARNEPEEADDDYPFN